MALLINDYDPRDHLVKIKSKDGEVDKWICQVGLPNDVKSLMRRSPMKDYYPASWRLYELSLKYPNANFSSEVLFFDVEKNTCLVKVRLYLGADHELSDKKAEAHKSGPYTSLDKVETAAMARAARNFGVGTEYALEFEAEDMAPGAVTLASIKATVRKLKIVRNPEQWYSFKRDALGEDIPDEQLTESHLSTLHGKVEQLRKAA